MLQDVVKVLTPEQQEKLKAQLGKRLRETSGRG
jgi:Spy/CpxP family protein refolding chaperone